MADHYYDIPTACFVDNLVLCNNLQDFLDDIHRRLSELETQTPQSFNRIDNRLVRIEKMHQINVMIGSTHCHSGWKPKQ